MKEITFIIPCYNEHPKVLQKTIDDLKKGLDKITYELIVVNDGSTKHEYSKIKHAKLISHKQNKGYGASLKTGIKNSKYSWIGIADSDGTYPVKDFPKLIKHMSDNDMVVGLRDKKGVPLLRKFPKLILRKLASFLANYKIPDLNSGMRLFKKDIALKFWKLFPEGFSFTSTITMACLTNGYDVKYVPIDYYKREGDSSISPIKDTIRFFNLVLRLTLYFNPVRFFIPLATLFFALFIWRGLRDYLLQGSFGGLTLVLFFMAFQTFFFGLLAEIINKK
ncbi:glycosyltransferase family 2 protein [Nanoarchaeota archaeon]